MNQGFVHLRVHTEYSLSDSVVRVPALIAAAAADGMPAVAVTDDCNLFAMVKFYRAALRAGVKPLVGVDLQLRSPEERGAATRFSLLCQSEAGYRNLTRLVTRAYLEGARQAAVPMIDGSWLDGAASEGLIALSGAAEGELGQALLRGRELEAGRVLDRWLERFGDRYYIELQRIGRADEAQYIAAAVALAAARGVPIVATNDVRFLTPDAYESHEARVCIHDGSQLADSSRTRRYTQGQYLRSAAEMGELFADLPEALANSVQIARRCSLPLTLGEPQLPAFPVPAGQTEAQLLRDHAVLGLQGRLAALDDSRGGDAKYQSRLDDELAVICAMGFAGYFLIVADFIRWARGNGIPVGPGRGSGAGSVVAWALGITAIDPLRHDLLFERFLNPERVSMPDFDVDFCMEGRDRVIDYVATRYGRDRVSQIITYGSLAAKAVVRDVGRVLGMSYGFVDRIAKLIPFEIGITLGDALVKEPELKRLYETEDEVRNLIDLARSLEGLTRNAGTHAGGVVIAPSLLTDFAPLYCEEGSRSVVTQFDKDDVEAAGLVKFDFLGLRTLTIIDRAVAAINAERARDAGPVLDIAKLPMEDAPTYTLLKSCRTTAVFQLESRGMKDLIRRLQPDCFDDVVALVALFRPGPLQSGMVDDFIARKHGRAAGEIDYLHPSLREILAPTYGVILYQEQVMQIAQVLAGYTLGGADLLRRAMGKKKPEEMAKQRSVFVSGAVARGVAQGQAAHIFDLMEKFAGYGFNKSHSAAYALLSYQTGWLKAHYPAAYMAAVLSADMDHTDKVVTLIDDCQAIGLKVLPPHVNSSVHAFAVADVRTLRYGLGAIRGVGASAVEHLIAVRASGGPFRSLEDLCARIDLSRLNRRVIESLVRSGSLDGLGANRATLMARVAAAMQAGEQATRALAVGQDDLFGGAARHHAGAAVAQGVPELPEFSESARLVGERETLGLYLTGHPIERFLPDLPRLVSARIGDLVTERPASGGEGERFGRGSRAVTVGGLITEIRKRGGRTSLVLDDRSGRIEVTLYDEVREQHRELIVRDGLVLVEGAVRFDEFIDGWRLAARRIQDLQRVRELNARCIVLDWPDDAHPGDGRLDRLADVLSRWPGDCRLMVRRRAAGMTGRLALGARSGVQPCRDAIEALEQLVGHARLRVVHAPAVGADATMAS